VDGLLIDELALKAKASYTSKGLFSCYNIETGSQYICHLKNQQSAPKNIIAVDLLMASNAAAQGKDLVTPETGYAKDCSHENMGRT
jgi:hypothetical protein